MISTIEIHGFKSIENLRLDLGRVNVFIGENGAGKSNILEAIALAGAATARKLDNEFLSSRGIRVTPPNFMRPAFHGCPPDGEIEVTATPQGKKESDALVITLKEEDAIYPKWIASVRSKRDLSRSDWEFVSFVVNRMASKRDITADERRELALALRETVLDTLVKADKDASVGRKTARTKTGRSKAGRKLGAGARKSLALTRSSGGSEVYHFRQKVPFNESFENFVINRIVDREVVEDLSSFVIYSPENSKLRKLEDEAQIEPLGINGEGLLKLLAVLAQSDDQSEINRIKKSLSLLGWFKDFLISMDGMPSNLRMEIQDKNLEMGTRFDQRSANEGFLFLAFYFALFNSTLTPRFFAIDNIDASLNPKLCMALTEELARVAKENGKQALLTTHNPAVLDGLNLDDPEQRLFVVSRDLDGYTRVRRFLKPKLEPGAKPVKLSEAFLRGSLGGLPKGF